MYRSAVAHIPRPQPDAPPSAEASPYDAATTLALRTPVGTDTLAADSKAAIVLTLLGIMFTVLARFGAEVGAVLHARGAMRIVCTALALGFIVCALCAVAQAFRTITPRFRKDKPSLAYFAEVARLEREEYFRRVESLTPRQALAQILIYNHTAARICAEKFATLRRCLLCFEMAAGCWLALAGILLFKGLVG